MLIVTGVKSSQIFGQGKTLSKERRKQMAEALGVDFLE